jgi:hypothetical protein
MPVISHLALQGLLILLQLDARRKIVVDNLFFYLDPEGVQGLIHVVHKAP